jgi:hypothetical protein
LFCNSISDQSPFEQLALPAPPVANGTAASATKADPGIDLLSWDDTPTTAANLLALVPVALVPVTDPLVESTSSNNNALAIVDMFSQNNTTNSNTAPADPFGLNPSSTIPGSQPYNTPTQQPLQSQQPQQVAPYANGVAVNPGTSSYEHASQFNNMSSGWNGQPTNPVTSAPQQALNYGMTFFLLVISFYSTSLLSVIPFVCVKFCVLLYHTSVLQSEHLHAVCILCSV